MTATLSTQKRHRIMLVDDHPVVRHGLAHLITSDPNMEVCCEVDGAEEALQAIARENPDVLVVDITLGGVSGLELIKQVRASHPKVRMLVTSMHDEKLYAERALHAGAMGYVHKQEAVEKIVTAIRQVLHGELYVSPDLAEHMLQRVMQGKEPVGATPIRDLTDRELEVFQLIGAGLTTRKIAERLNLSPKTIETHRDHIKTKLNIASNNELVKCAVEWSLQQP